MKSIVDINAIKQRMQGLDLQERESQMRMMQTVAETIAQGKVCCIEAPTGIGKTLAYLIAALEQKSKDDIVVVSTATIALQEQLLNNDIPLLEKILGRTIKAAIAKGRKRYVCQSRLYHPEQYLADSSQATFVYDLQQLLDKKRWNGERDTLDSYLDAHDWSLISTDSSGCAAGNCSYYEDCQFFRAKKRAAIADVVITNHSLLLSDLELGGGVVLPEMEKCIYIIDECHHLPEKATDYFSLQAALMRSTDWINTWQKSTRNAALQNKKAQVFAEKSVELSRALVASLSDMRFHIDSEDKKFVDDVWHFSHVSEDFKTLAKAIIHFADQISQCCEQLINLLEEQQELSKDKELASSLNSLMGSLGFVLQRSENLAQTWQHLCQDKNEFGVPIARWLQKKKIDLGEIDYTAFAAPINASAKLKSVFWDKISLGAVLCSATVRTLGKFDDYIRRAGLKGDSRVVTLMLPSPFAYQESLLFIPQMKAEPIGSNQQVHIDEVKTLLPKLMLPKGGTLVLFTSKSAMRSVFESLDENWRPLVLIQGDKGKSKLIESHKIRIERGQASILFGLASFAEGLDLPGDYCQHVIIHKLPFAVPADPIEKTRNAWLKQHQLDPFKLVSLPRTSIKLTQYVGRLLRKETDVGMVTILDKRLYVKHYGKSLLDNLPAFHLLLNQSFDQLNAQPLAKKLLDS